MDFIYSSVEREAVIGSLSLSKHRSIMGYVNKIRYQQLVDVKPGEIQLNAKITENDKME
jgi:hypothetical protein